MDKPASPSQHGRLMPGRAQVSSLHRWACLRGGSSVPLWLAAVLAAAADPLPTIAPGERSSNGRVEKPTLPQDLPNPDRWRYTPDDLLKPGTLLSRDLVSSFILPDVAYERDIGLTLGVSIADFDFRNQRRQEYAEFYASHSTLGQEDYEIKWRRYLHAIDLPGQGELVNERGTVEIWSGYQKTLTTRFFGFGPETSEFDQTGYTLEQAWVTIAYEEAYPMPGDDLLYGLALELSHQNLGTGHVDDVPSTTQEFPQLTASGHDVTQVWTHLHLRYDTRDSLENPYHGWHVGVYEDALLSSGGQRTGLISTLRAGYAHRLPGLFHNGQDAAEDDPPTDVLAVDWFVRWTTGVVPYYELPSLGGGETLRGYITNRWTDRAVWHASIEYRLWVLPRGLHITPDIGFQRIGLAPFVDVGGLGTAVADLLKTAVKTSYGLGLRLALDRTSIVRADVGWSREGVELNIDYNLAF